MLFNTAELKREAEWVKRFVEKKTTIPILGNIAIVAGPNGLTLMATNLEIAGIATVDVATATSSIKDGDAPPWAVTVPAEHFCKYLAKIEEPTVALIPAEGFRLQLRHGESAVATFDGMTGDSYPQIPLPTPQLMLRGLKQAIARTQFAVSQEESRFSLNGALLDLRPNMAALVATDGHRLSYCEIDADRPEKPMRSLIHKDALTEIAGMNGGSAWFGQDDDHQIFTCGKRTIVARKLVGNFPDYERVLPKSHDYEAVVHDPKALLKVVDRVRMFADERSQALVFEIEPENKAGLEVRASTVDRGSASGSVPIEFDGKPAPQHWTSGFDARYVADFLRVVDTGFRMRLSKAEKNGCCSMATAFTVPHWQYVVMPVRI